ncbi:hypothetical protein F7725_002282 [Dissostichus mawsoni]|uniref:UDP-glucuronic acid decarboxylase 1 n=1 Tax=Dissostichus mawsoni TaxID=36200 RepID=A0A7J5Y304_DISMA|nr:hypothetical protein F7725_002282 [Dissostichus mawsoni]
MMKRIIWLISGLNRRMMKLLFALALIAYIASVWGTYTNMRLWLLSERRFVIWSKEIPTCEIPVRKGSEENSDHRWGGVCGFPPDGQADDGHEVTVVDNFFTGRKRNVEHWIGHENFELINHDVVEPLYIEVDQIYHLASPASPPNYMYNPIKTLKTNTIGTLNMLGLAKRVGARLLLASTSEVYGDPEVHPQNEEYWGHVNPIGPRACYDEGKRVAETMCYAYMKQEGVEVRVARIFNTFGSRMHMNDGRVVSNFILQALQGEPLTGNPEEHTILEFARLIKSLAQDDPQRRRPDIRKANMMLGWEPVEGLNKTIQYFSRELEHQANNQYIPKPKAARMKKGRPRHN